MLLKLASEYDSVRSVWRWGQDARIGQSFGFAVFLRWPRGAGCGEAIAAHDRGKQWPNCTNSTNCTSAFEGAAAVHCCQRVLREAASPEFGVRCPAELANFRRVSANIFRGMVTLRRDCRSGHCQELDELTRHRSSFVPSKGSREGRIDDRLGRTRSASCEE